MTQREGEEKVWRVRPSGTKVAGKAVSLTRLQRALAEEEMGELDEVRGLDETDSDFMPIIEHPFLGQYVPRPRRRSSREQEDAETDMTPMIDVTFQLVIFFMIAASFTVQKTLDMPPSNSAQGMRTREDVERTNIMVYVGSDGQIRVDGESIPVEDLDSHLRDVVKSRGVNELALEAANQSLHDHVVQVIDAAGAANIQRVYFVSQASQDAPGD